uniref:Uncharacterized protein n=1 Tax=Arundo donax TaxID=35708 RepID=A0A0A9BVQ1_ARUDO
MIGFQLAEGMIKYKPSQSWLSITQFRRTHYLDHESYVLNIQLFMH